MKESAKVNKEDVGCATNEDNFAIQISGLTKKFGNLTAVDGVNLSIKKGEMLSLLGPNGAGKTTTIKMLCCLLEPTAGTATVMGYDMQKSRWRLKRLLVYHLKKLR